VPGLAGRQPQLRERRRIREREPDAQRHADRDAIAGEERRGVDLDLGVVAQDGQE
jgi:hypothetical protein